MNALAGIIADKAQSSGGKAQSTDDKAQNAVGKAHGASQNTAVSDMVTLNTPMRGYGHPGDPAFREVSLDAWFADLDRAWEAQLSANPNTRLSLLGFSQGALVGLCWALERQVPLHRMLAISPAWGLKPLYRIILGGLFRFLPGRVVFPSPAPSGYGFHGFSSVAAYRAQWDGMKALERKTLKDQAHKRNGRLPLPPFPPRVPIFIAYTKKDELIDTRLVESMAEANRKQVWLHQFRHQPDKFFPHHLALDEETLGHEEWVRLKNAVRKWDETAGDAKSV